MPKRPWVAKNKIFSCLPEGAKLFRSIYRKLCRAARNPNCRLYQAVQFRTVVRSASLRKRVQHSAASVALSHPIARPKTFQLQIGKHAKSLLFSKPY
jgi:hypothetical protein